jgi:putative transposase
VIAQFGHADDIETMKLKHYDHDGRARFITFCTHRKFPLLTNNIYREIVVRIIDEVRKESGFRLLGYVIMPDHVHLVIVPRIETKAGEIIGEIKMRSSMAIYDLMRAGSGEILTKLMVKRSGTEKFAFWQRRCYDHNCRSDEAIWKAVEYCHNNPVKKRLVAGPERWIWSSYNWYRGNANSVIEIDVSG